MRQGKDYATGKMVYLSKPEESVRQEYERVLVEGYGYIKEELAIEVRIPRGSGYFKERADIVVYDNSGYRDPASNILGIVEVKRPTVKSGISQLKSYMTATSAIWGVWTNGNNIAYVSREGSRIIEGKLNNIPARGQSIADVGKLNKSDLKPFTQSELKSAFRRILDTLYANTNVSRQDKLGNEMTKVIFSKLQDERTYPERPPAFRVEYDEKPKDVAKRIHALFKSVRDELKSDGVFAGHEKITLDDKSLAWVVGQLERGSLLNTDSDVVGDAFEVFSESKFIGEKGEFFTPRGIVKIAVKLTNPSPRSTICDPACGSGGFLIYAMKHIWEEMEKLPEWRNSTDIRQQKKEMAARSFFGIDKETDLVKIAKAHMAIAGDGRSNIVHENSLHKASEFGGESSKHFVEEDNFRCFDFVLTNPPFGTKTKVQADDSANFKLGKKWTPPNKKTKKWKVTTNSQERDPYILFIERCISMLKRGGGQWLSSSQSRFFMHPHSAM
ncbi:MAG: N-6 DNA methylase [Gammaproteobacteria bacterium]|nr:N-6 DNA methylase [Gammaproteobacteria bacterium]